MIYTLTLNPAIDYTMTVNDYCEGRVNRSDRNFLSAGGKGINAAVILSRLGISAKALGFCGGETGELLCSLMDGLGCVYSMTRLEGQLTRINVKLRCGDCETEINGRGADISPAVLEDFLADLEKTLVPGDTLVLAGSVPPSLPDTVYGDITRRSNALGVRIAADCDRSAFVKLIPHHPFLVKPNDHELSQAVGMDIDSHEDALLGAEKLQQMGAENVLVSLAGKGAVLLTSTGEHFITAAPVGSVVNSVGAGDSMLAGFLAGLEIFGDYETALFLGTASGSATAFSERLAERGEILRIFDELCPGKRTDLLEN